MKHVQMYLSWLISFCMVMGTTAFQGCSAKEAAVTPAAQTQPANAPAQGSNPQQASAAGVDPREELPEVNLTPAGLDELMAPVALYPDPVVAVLLQAATNPQEVMDGGNWLVLDANQNLKEEALDVASKKAGFTPVMQALLHYPTVVDLMCQQFDWTKQIGAAYQGNPKSVLDSVQRLRAQAVDTGALKSSPQMSVDIKQDNGQQVVELKPTDPKVVYVPQYDPSRVYTTTTTTSPDGTTTTTTTGPAATSTNTTTVVKEQSSGVSTGSAVLIGLLSFGAGIAVGAAINNNNYYYPAWGYGHVYYGGRPYYPPPYRPVYVVGWGGGYGYNRPVHYGNNNITINNNNNYYNRFNNNNNLNSNYKPKPIPYNNQPGSTYSKNTGSRPGNNQGSTYRPANNANNGPGNGNNQNRPGAGNNAGAGQRPADGNNGNNWKGQTTYQGNTGGNKGGNNAANRPGNANGNVNGNGPGNNTGGRPGNTGNVAGNGVGAVKPGSGNAGANNRVNTGNTPSRNPSGDRGYGQSDGGRPSTGNAQASRPSAGTQPAARPAQQPASQPQSSNNAFGGAESGKADKAASNRGRSSMGAPAAQPAAKPAAKPAQSRAPSGGTRKGKP